MNLKNERSSAPGRASDASGSVEDFDSRKNKFNQQIGTKELQELIKEEASSAGHTGSDPATTKAKDTPELEFKKPGEGSGEAARDLHRVTSYNNILPVNEDLSSNEENEKKLRQKKEADKGAQVEPLDEHTKNLIDQVMGVSPTSDASFNHSNLNAIRSEGYFTHLKMNDPS